MEQEGTECRRGISLVELSQSDPKLVEYRDDVKVRPRGEAGTSTKFPLSSFEDEASWPAQSRPVPFRQPQQLSFSEEELTWRGDTDFSLSHSPSPDEFYKAALRKKTALGIQFRGDSKPFPKRTRVSKTNRQRPHISESTCDVFAERGLRREGEMMEMKEGKRLGQDTGYSTASSPNWHTPPTDGSRGMMRKKPKLFRQEGVQEAPTFTSALYRQTSSNHCSIGSDRSGQSSHRELQSRRNRPSSPRMAPHIRR
ncbi:uncharacterized protein [Palaemon carinicauda]|uniref:uncharacterized protein n=1 Tax=Palaemon carinicauda TaxID=392227 RepID=UPI0035B64250